MLTGTKRTKSFALVRRTQKMDSHSRCLAPKSRTLRKCWSGWKLSCLSRHEHGGGIPSAVAKPDLM